MLDTIYIESKDAAFIQTDAQIIAVKKNEIGYWPIYTRATAAALNREVVTPEIVESALCASMYGWTVPGAKPALEYFHSADHEKTI